MKYYLTTPIYYVNAAPHIGHTYTTIVADLVRRLKTMQGYQAVLTTGTDEHGQKVERSAKAAGKTPEEFTTIIAGEFRGQWEKLGLKIDRFQRTTNPFAVVVLVLHQIAWEASPMASLPGLLAGNRLAYCPKSTLNTSTNSAFSTWKTVIETADRSPVSVNSRCPVRPS